MYRPVHVTFLTPFPGYESRFYKLNCPFYSLVLFLNVKLFLYKKQTYRIILQIRETNSFFSCQC